jgi:hypothetical protein
METLQIDAPLGAPITDFIDLAKHTPPGYNPTGVIIGDTVAKSPFSFAIVVYDSPNLLDVTVLHMTQRSAGSDIYDLNGKDTFKALDGELINSASKTRVIAGYAFANAAPPTLKTGEYSKTIIIFYNLT